ncbi:MAG: hypothetical protein ACD_75C01219G0001, partial [uncultured bacterium]
MGRPELLPSLQIFCLRGGPRQERGKGLEFCRTLLLQISIHPIIPIEHLVQAVALGKNEGLLVPSPPGGGEMALVLLHLGIGDIEGPQIAVVVEPWPGHRAQYQHHQPYEQNEAWPFRGEQRDPFDLRRLEPLLRADGSNRRNNQAGAGRGKKNTEECQQGHLLVTRHLREHQDNKNRTGRQESIEHRPRHLFQRAAPVALAFAFDQGEIEMDGKIHSDSQQHDTEAQGQPAQFAVKKAGQADRHGGRQVGHAHHYQGPDVAKGEHKQENQKNRRHRQQHPQIRLDRSAVGKGMGQAADDARFDPRRQRRTGGIGQDPLDLLRLGRVGQGACALGHQKAAQAVLAHEKPFIDLHRELGPHEVQFGKGERREAQGIELHLLFQGNSGRTVQQGERFLQAGLDTFRRDHGVKCGHVAFIEQQRQGWLKAAEQGKLVALRQAGQHIGEPTARRQQLAQLPGAFLQGLLADRRRDAVRMGRGNGNIEPVDQPHPLQHPEVAPHRLA